MKYDIIIDFENKGAFPPPDVSGLAALLFQAYRLNNEHMARAAGLDQSGTKSGLHRRGASQLAGTVHAAQLTAMKAAQCVHSPPGKRPVNGKCK